MSETCWICQKEKGQPPDRCPGHYESFSELIQQRNAELANLRTQCLAAEAERDAYISKVAMLVSDRNGWAVRILELEQERDQYKAERDAEKLAANEMHALLRTIAEALLRPTDSTYAYWPDEFPAKIKAALAERDAAVQNVEKADKLCLHWMDRLQDIALAVNPEWDDDHFPPYPVLTEEIKQIREQRDQYKREADALRLELNRACGE